MEYQSGQSFFGDSLWSSYGSDPFQFDSVKLEPEEAGPDFSSEYHATFGTSDAQFSQPPSQTSGELTSHQPELFPAGSEPVQPEAQQVEPERVPEPDEASSVPPTDYLPGAVESQNQATHQNFLRILTPGQINHQKPSDPSDQSRPRLHDPSSLGVDRFPVEVKEELLEFDAVDAPAADADADEGTDQDGVPSVKLETELNIEEDFEGIGTGQDENSLIFGQPGENGDPDKPINATIK